MTAVYTSPLRVSEIELTSAADALVAECPVLPDILESVPHPAVVVNGSRQILLWNQCLSREAVRGLRAGEVFGCANAPEGPEGCGSSENCSLCGAWQALSNCLNLNKPAQAECRIRTEGGASSEYMVSARPLCLGSGRIAIAVFQDIGVEKRRDVLERVFLHDLLNTAAGITGILDLLSMPGLAPGETAFFHRQLSTLAGNLVEEIRAHRQVTEAENGTVRVEPVRVNIRMLLTALSTHSADLKGRIVQFAAVPDVNIVTDIVLLRRVLTNLVRNALEASRAGDVVTLWCDVHDDCARFHVHNPSVMTEDVKRQVFQRSFTTKAEAGHGLGTYSAKLFAERYLKGRVSFQSGAPDGTVFTVVLPRELRQEPVAEESQTGWSV